MVRHNCHGMFKHSMFTVFLFYKEKERLTGEGCVGVVIPLQFCRTIGPLTLHSQEIGCALNSTSQDKFLSMQWTNNPYIPVLLITHFFNENVTLNTNPEWLAMHLCWTIGPLLI